jgi:alkylhydroperoxidase/carboxymuconolactone decarboxylase family protein YurZ
MKCVYCIPAHTAFARAAGATEEEIKTAVAIAADVALNSSMLYGSQFDMETFMKMFE